MLADMTVKDFLAETWSNSPVPGGGSVAALCGATAAALTGMVANLTVGKKNYIEVNGEMLDIAKEVEQIKNDLLEDIDRDCDAFNKVMDCFKMPKETDKEKELRAEKIQETTKGAIQAPLLIAKKTLALMDIIDIVVQKGNKNAITDGAVGAMMARTSVLAALYNVRINLASIKNQEYVNAMEIEVSKIEKEAISKEKEILANVVL